MGEFVNHSYWTYLEIATISENISILKLKKFIDTEEFIEDLYPVYGQFDFRYINSISYSEYY